MNYPFDVSQAVMFLGNMADLIFVFFDPIGQALCKRTLNLVEGLNTAHSERIKMYLSKADEAGHEADRQKVLMQIVQELCKRPCLNKAGFDLPTIFIPNPNKPARCLNQIEEVCKDIEKTINRTVQNTLNTLESDCDKVEQVISQKLERDRLHRTENFQSNGKSICFFLMGLILPSIVFLSFLTTANNSTLITSILGKSTNETLFYYLSPVHLIWKSLPPDYQTIVSCALMISSVLLLLIANWFSRSHPTLNKKEKRALEEKREYVHNVVRSKKHSLYQKYLLQSVTEQEL